MAWANSGLYPATLNQILSAGANAPSLTVTTNKFFLTSNSDSTLYAAALGATGNIYAGTYEITGTGWAAGGPLLSAAYNGGAMTPSLTVSGTSPVLLVWSMANPLSVTGTTLTGAYGGYFYQPLASYQYKIVGIYFGGSAYSTVAGTFAITWSSGQVFTINCAANT